MWESSGISILKFTPTSLVYPKGPALLCICSIGLERRRPDVLLPRTVDVTVVFYYYPVVRSGSVVPYGPETCAYLVTLWRCLFSAPNPVSSSQARLVLYLAGQHTSFANHLFFPSCPCCCASLKEGGPESR